MTALSVRTSTQNESDNLHEPDEKHCHEHEQEREDVEALERLPVRVLSDLTCHIAEVQIA